MCRFSMGRSCVRNTSNSGVNYHEARWKGDAICRTLDYCRECGMSLSLPGRSEEAPNTCPDCAAKLRVSFFGECSRVDATLYSETIDIRPICGNSVRIMARKYDEQ